MKFFRPLALTVALLAGPFAHAEDGKLLSSFRGVYRGTVVLKLNGHTYKGPARIEVTTERRTATITLSGGVRIARRTMPLANQLVFQRSGSVAERSITNGLAGRKVGARGFYAAVPQRLNFRGAFSSGGVSGTTSGTATVRREGRKQFLRLKTSVRFSTGRQDYFFRFKVWNYAAP